MLRLNSFSFTLAVFLASSTLHVWSLPQLDEQECNPGYFFYQYAVVIYSTSSCRTCPEKSETCNHELHGFVHRDFPGYAVQVVNKRFRCGSNGRNVVLLRLRLCPREEQGEGNSSSMELERMLECSGHLPSDVDFEPCSYYTTKHPVVPPTSTVGTNLIAVIVTVFAAVAVLLLGVLMYWKRQEVAAFAKRWAPQCRGRQPAEDSEIQPLLGDQPPQPHPVQVQDGEERNDDDGSFNIAEWARRVLELPFIGPQWANPVARGGPAQPQSNGTGSNVSSTSRLFEALVDMPLLLRRVSPEGSGYCSLDYQRR